MGIKVSKISPYGLKWLEKQPVETKIEMLQFHGDLCKLLANDILEELTRRYTGDKYDRKAESSYYRNGYNPSSMSIGGEKFSVNVPGIRKKDSDQSVNIPEFSEIRDSSAPPERLVRALLSGLSTHDYDSVLGQITDSFGLSSSTVSRRFKEASSEKLQAFLTRDLSAHKFIAMFIDGKYLRSDQIVIALGVTDQGVKVPLGFIQTTTENTKAISQLFTDLINRGFDFSDGFLAIIDGSKGIKSALDKVFGHKAIIQRCRIHKERNVMSYLNDKDQSLWKQRIRKAFMEPTAYAAKCELQSVAKELEQINQSAANSLREGMEETLTLHRLKINPDLQHSFRSTNCIESLNSNIASKLRNVKRTTNSEQLHRWIATVLIEQEPKMRRINAYNTLNQLQKAIRKEIERIENQKKLKNNNDIENPSPLLKENSD